MYSKFAFTCSHCFLSVILPPLVDLCVLMSCDALCPCFPLPLFLSEPWVNQIDPLVKQDAEMGAGAALVRSIRERVSRRGQNCE